jgi:hypothetical protein
LFSGPRRLPTAPLYASLSPIAKRLSSNVKRLPPAGILMSRLKSYWLSSQPGCPQGELHQAGNLQAGATR